VGSNILPGQADNPLEERAPTWVRGVSIPAAILGVIAFFLPWVEISCGPVALQLSGYEIATGKSENKPESFWDQNRALWQGRQVRGQRKQFSAAERAPMLWIVPGACAVLALLAAFGLPRVPTLVVTLIAAGYFAYFGVSSEHELSDPHNTAGLVTHRWLAGFWAAWLGLLVPMLLCWIRPPRSRR